MTASPSPPPADQVEAAQVLYEAMKHPQAEAWTGLPAFVKERWRHGVAALRPVTSVAPEGMREEAYRLGAWMSAALDDPGVCAAMKADITAWFNAGQPVASALPPASGSDHGPVG